jgi:hypothetical protein
LRAAWARRPLSGAEFLASIGHNLNGGTKRSVLIVLEQNYPFHNRSAK